MSEPRPAQRVRRLAIEALSVAAGVLLAFSVDAWWERVQERDILEGLRSAAEVEAAENLDLLGRYRVAGDRSLEAGRRLIDMIAPEPADVPLDTVLFFMGTLLSYNAAPLELAATDRLLASGDIESLLDPDFHRGLLQLRARSTGYYDQGVRFERIHEELVREFGRVAPLAVLSASKDGGLHPQTDFPVDARTVLSSPGLEGAVGNLLVWVDNLNTSVDRLVDLSNAVWAPPPPDADP
ncbi:MAG: hypothetical protein AAF389_10185 [Gemmatimonadota bacterium]